MTLIATARPSDMRLSDVLALASTYVNVKQDLDTVTDLRADHQAEFEFSADDADFRVWFSRKMELNAQVETAAAIAQAAYNSLYEIVRNLAHGDKRTFAGRNDSGRAIRITYEPVLHHVTVWREEL